MSDVDFDLPGHLALDTDTVGSTLSARVQGNPAGEDGGGTDDTLAAPPALAAEIDGEATNLGTGAPGAARSVSAAAADAAFVVARLGGPYLQVEPGAASALPVFITNGGPQIATFSLWVTDFAAADWCVDLPWAVDLAPGEEAVVQLTVQPPRLPAARAGEYPLTVVVDSPDFPGHGVALPLTLAVLPFDALEVAITAPPHRALSWLRRRATLSCAVSNGGNRALTVRLRAHSHEDRCRFDYRLAAAATTSQAVLGLGPGERAEVTVGVVLPHAPILGRGVAPLPMALAATPDENPAAAARARLVLPVQPLVGPWQIAALASLGLIGMLASLLLAALVVAGQLRPGTPAAVPTAPPLLYPPPVIIVNLAAPLPESPAVAAPALAEAQPDPGLPLVLPNQVTAPGSGGPLRRARPGDDSGSVAPAVAAQTTGNAESLSYSQMFREIGLRYDLDWRLLAALAYVESGFDVMALSGAGAMGLMQILPETWREWAPAADASDPFDAYASTLVAAAYLDHLRSELARDGRSEPQWMLVAYNWGPDRLREFLAAGNTWESLPEARRQYAADVLRIAKTIP